MRGVLERIVRRLRPARPRPVILMYHRVAAIPIDPWGLAVHPDRFRAHMDVLRKHRTPLPMSEVVRRLHSGTLPDNAVGVTFDDGYADNAQAASPCLTAVGVPATMFLVAGAIGQPWEFWWDEVARGTLGRRDSLDCAIPVNGTVCHLKFPAVADSDKDMGANASWRAWQESRTARQQTYLEFWRQLRDAHSSERDRAMHHFRQAAAMSRPSPADLPMTPADVERIARDGLIEIGGHTLTHPALPQLDSEARRRELLDGKRRCEELAGREIAGFAYPHGALDDSCRAAVRDAGFRWACTTAAGPVQSSSDLHRLPRLFVQDWDADAFEAALR